MFKYYSYDERDNFHLHVGKIFLHVLIVLSILIWLSKFGWHRIETPPGHETVLIDKPWFGGQGGARTQTQQPGTGWYWFSTVGLNVETTPIRYDEPLDDLVTADNNFLDFNTYIVLQWHDAAYNVQKFGWTKWYDHNLKEPYRTIVRNEAKRYQMTPLMTDNKTSDEMERSVRETFAKVIAESGLKVTIRDMSIGRGRPNQPVVDEMDRTAAQQQRKKSEDERKKAEDARSAAEASRAKADNAYREAMRMDTTQFIELEKAKIFAAACRDKASCVIVNGAATPIQISK